MKGVLTAVNEADLYKQLQKSQLELIQCAQIKETPGLSYITGFFKKGVKTRDLIQLFIQLEQMQGAGIGLLDALSDAKDTADAGVLRDMLNEIHRDVMEGSSLSEAMRRYPYVFNNLYISLISAGEETGDLVSSYKKLIVYLNWLDDMQVKVKKATRYPMILLGVIIITITIMMGVVVPQIVGFIANLDQELPFYTVWLVNTSNFFQASWHWLLIVPTALVGGVKAGCTLSDEFALYYDKVMLQLPVFGPIIRKINIARYAQTFGSLYSSGIEVIRALNASKQTVTNKSLFAALQKVEENVLNGKSLSASFNESGEFPSLIIRMLRIGEESGNLSGTMEQVSMFYTKDVDEAVEGLITLIEPALTLIMGLMLLWIAAGVFGPIYGSFSEIDF